MYLERGIQFILKPYLGLIFIFTALGSWQAFITHSTWHIGDWLINYQGGFVRRGLLGELIYQLALYTDISPGFYVFLIQIVCNALFLLFSYLLLKQQRALSPFILLIFSPFIFAFQINSFDQYESVGGYFKDCIFCCGMAFIGWSAAVHQVRTFEKIYYGFLLCYPLLILSHEAFAVFLPYIVVVYVTKVEVDRRRILLHAGLISLSIISFIVCFQFSGNNGQVAMIYNSLLTKYPVTTYGSIGWLALPVEAAVQRVHIQINYNEYFKNYCIIVLLSMIAFLPVLQQLKRVFKNKIACFLMLTAILGTVVLCSIAIDWGRFIRFNLVSLFIISLVAGALCSHKTNETLVKHKINMQHAPYLLYAVVLLFTLGYALLWRVPSCCNYRPPVSDLASNNLSWSYKPYKKIMYDIKQWVNTI